jgi:4-hydroxythreonine-4-phosphate dehydrogenase
MSKSLVMTAGDPCGIGPEVILKALSRPLPNRVRVVIVGDVAVFKQAAARLGRRLPRENTIELLDLAHRQRYTPGKPGAASGQASLDYLDAAIHLLRSGTAGGLVTGPVTKWAIERAGHPFQGHTEYLAKALGAPAPVMMFVSPKLRVVLLTRHVALREVPRRVTPALLRHTIRATADGLRRYFGVRRPRLAICGLNPHAGEAGMFGGEEQRLLAPLLRASRFGAVAGDGVRLDGPVSADGFFVNPSGYDAVLCWYHDQGLIPFKLLARDTGCQLTLGLPIIRTSPDHGSAPDIAGKNLAHPGSMRYALELAAKLVHAHQIRTP